MKDILIIDDDELIREALVDMFSNFSFETAASHCEAISLLSKNTYKLIICDYDLSKQPCCNMKTGYSVYVYLQNKNDETPFALYTSHPDIKEDFSGQNFLGIINKSNFDELMAQAEEYAV